MALSAKAGTFNIGTGAASSTVAVTGVGFTPKAVLFFIGDSDSAPDTSSDRAHQSFGGSAGSAENAASAFAASPTATQASTGINNAANCVATRNSATGTVGLAAIQSFDADGFTLVINTAFPVDRVVGYLALGGDDVVDTAVGQATFGFFGSSVSVTGLGFAPNLVLLWGMNGNSISFGWDDGTVRGAGAWASQHLVSTTNTWSMLSSSKALLMINSSGAYSKGVDSVAMDADGFTASYAGGTGNSTVFGYLALNITSKDIATLAALTAPGSIQRTGIGFEPAALLAMTVQGVTASQSAPSDHGRLTFGVASAADSRVSVSVSNPDAQSGGSNTRTRTDNANLLSVLSTAAPPVVDHEIDLTSFDAGGYTLDQSDAASSTDLMLMLALGPAAGGGGGAVELSVAGTRHGHKSARPSLIQAHVLSAANVRHGHTAATPALTQAHVLDAASARHAHGVERPSLTQAHTIAVAGARHAHAAERPTLVQAHALAVAESRHAHRAERPTASATGSFDLSVENLRHAHRLGRPSLVQAHAIAVVSIRHAHTAGRPTVSTGLGLNVPGTRHPHTAATPELVQAHILDVPDSRHAHVAANPALLQANILSIADVRHAHTVGELLLAQGFALTVVDTRHGHSAALPSLTQAHLLDIAGVRHAHTVSALGLLQANVLSVAGSRHAHTVGLLYLIDDSIILVPVTHLLGSMAGPVALTGQRVGPAQLIGQRTGPATLTGQV